ncbi:MAG TPA: 3-hydroxyacyl-CoA dehydrogenase NAD-binding domain-containing protein, partial [Gemmatimonadaceae bacterium]|nr:3-hydroxyacyl-CoA dehydrogenase NAD-binding domain-containing protein [Gemmatimonadaceae bacterium]
MSQKIAVIGAGQMGNGIAHVFAQSGFPVTMIDVAQAALDKGKSTIEKNLDRQVKKGTIDAAAKDATLGRIALNTGVASAGDAALVVEAATENRDLKFRIFSDLDKVAP